MKHRTFLAIDLPAAQKSAVKSLQTSLDALALPVVWEPVEKLHLTLNFLGTIDDDTLSRVKHSFTKAVSGFPPFSLQPAFLETLYNRHEPSLIYLGLSGDIDQLKELRNLTTDAAHELKLPQAYRFLPHITIGRLKRADPVATKSFLDQVNDFNFSPLLPFAVEYIHLYESFVSKSGSVYQSITKFNF